MNECMNECMYECMRMHIVALSQSPHTIMFIMIIIKEKSAASSEMENNGVEKYGSTTENTQRENVYTDNDFLCGFYKPMIALCILGFMNMMGVGSVNDWSTVYFRTILFITPFYSTAGYATFISMVIV